MEKHHNIFELPDIKNSEVAIFAKRLVGVFQILMTKLELVAVLPFIYSHPDIMNILSDRDTKCIVTFFSKFISDREDSAKLKVFDTDSSSSDNQTHDGDETSDKSSCTCGSMKDRLVVYELIQIMISNPILYELAIELKVETSKSNNFLRHIKYFMDFVVSKTLSMPLEEREKEVNLRKLLAEIEQSKLKVSELTIALEEQKGRQRAEAQELLNKLDNLLDQWQQIDEEYNESLTELLYNSKESKARALEEFTERINNHEATFEKSKQQLADNKINNKKIEGDIQKLKFKVESQLTSLINKYDTEIGERQEIYENLMKEYEDLQQEKSQLMDDMNEQLVIYKSIMDERDAKAFEEYKEKYDKFVQNRSAKIIQRWWRKVLAHLKKKRKKDKKKGKNKKKGK